MQRAWIYNSSETAAQSKCEKTLRYRAAELREAARLATRLYGVKYSVLYFSLGKVLKGATMSAGICRIQKVKTAHDIAGVQLHDRREREHSNSNPDIDFSRSCNNITLIDAEGSFNEHIAKQIKGRYKGSKAVRKDAVRLVQAIFTSDSEFFADKSKSEQMSFFQSCLDFAKRQWGEENIVSAIIHNDEKTPHLHLNFIPLTKDGKLSAKEILGGRKEMQKFQDDFYREVSGKFGLERGHRSDLDNPEDVPAKHLTVTELKKKTQAKELEERVQSAQKQAEHIDNITQLVREGEPIKKFGRTTEYIKIPYEPFVQLKKAAKGYDEDRKEVKRLQGLLDKAMEEIEKLKREIKQLYQKTKDMLDLQNQARLMKTALKIPQESDYKAVLRELNKRGYDFSGKKHHR